MLDALNINNRESYRRVIVYLSIFFILGIATIVTILSIRAAKIQQLINSTQTYAEIINKSGRQRMLSQLIVKSQLLDSIQLTNNSTHQIDSLLALFEQSHEELFSFSETINSNDSLNHLFNEITPYYHGIINSSKPPDTKNYKQLINYADSFLPIMEEITTRFEKRSNQEFVEVKDEISSLNYVVATAVFLIGYAVFLITMIIIRYYSRQLNKTQKQLQSQYEKTRDNADTLEFLTRSINVGIWEKNLKEGFERWNKEMYQILGLEVNSIEGTDENFLNLVHEDDKDLLRMASKESIKSQSPQTVELRVRMSDGSYKWVEATGNVKTNSKGEIELFVGGVIDINARKLFEAQLKEAKKNAEKLSHTKSEFLSNMSHEIRTPLNGIIGLTRILLNKSPREDQLKELNLLKFSGENLLSIVNDILDFNKIESGKLTLENIDFNLFGLLENIAHTHTIKCQEKGIEFKFSYDTKLPQVLKGDSVRIGQIINNLINNAIKFTHKGEVKLEARFKDKKDGQIALSIAVIDTGIGIKPENQDKIFSRFEQENTDTTRQFGGTGLGLSICRNLTELMGGHISIKSEYGKGSEFIFEVQLPLGDQRITVENELLNEQNIDFSKQNFKVLVAEDNLINYTVLENLLTPWGITVDHSLNGQEAIELANLNKYTLIFMDLQMPELDGFMAAKQIKKKGLNTKTPIIALSASVLESTKNQALTSGMVDYLTKPVISHQLIEKIIQHTQIKPAIKQQKLSDSLVLEPADIKSILKDAAKGDAAVQQQLRDLVLNGMTEFRTNFKSFHKNNDKDNLDKIVHKIMPTIKLLKLNTLEELFSDFETNPGAVVELDEVMKEVDQLVIELNQISYH